MRTQNALLAAALLLGSGLACTAGGAGPGDDAGAAATTGQAGSTGTGGSTQPAGGSTGAAGQASTGSGSAGRVSTGDNGDLFNPDAAVPANTLPSNTAGSTGTGTGTADASASTPEGGSGIPGDGHMATAHSGGFTLVFTQKGLDVTLVISGCTGTHKVEVHEGYACDDPTKGPVWGGTRGTGIFNAASMFSCDATTKSATYTRTGADPKTSWTVADHDPTTDVTLHPILVDTSCGTFF
ncbi:MAG TPA: hypothetical protein VGK52_07400 [Polyangia bacterium]|jgi:hypothetical protein